MREPSELGAAFSSPLMRCRRATSSAAACPSTLHRTDEASDALYKPISSAAAHAPCTRADQHTAQAHQQGASSRLQHPDP